MKKTILVTVILLVLSLSAVALVACKEDPKELSQVTNIVYDGVELTWKHDKSDDTSSLKYEISIDDGEAKTSTSTNYKYDAKGKTFKVAIKAVSLLESVADSGVTENTFTKLNDVANIVLKDGVLQWDAVENAEGYEVIINKGGVKEIIKASTNMLTELPGGSYSIQIRAVNDNGSYYGVASAAKNVLVLSAPIGVVYNSATSRLSWENVVGNKGYSVIINDVVTVVENNHMDISLTASFTAKVKALGDNETVYDSSYSEVTSFYYLNPILEFNVVDGKLNWEDVKDADAYRIKIDGTLQEEVLTTSEYGKFVANQRYTVQIMPINTQSNYFSAWSADQTLTIIGTPTIAWNNGAVMWSAVPGASGYSVTVNHEGNIKIIKNGEDALSLANAFDAVGEYEVSVQANSEENDYYSSGASNVVKITRLAAPKAYDLVDDPRNVGETTLSLKDAPSKARSYSVLSEQITIGEINGTVISLGGLTTPSLDETRVVIDIKSLGDVSPNGTSVILDSKELLTIELTKLAVPKNIRLTNNKIQFENVDMSTGYLLFLNSNNGASVEAGAAISTELSAGKNTLRIRAMGNGSNILSSDASNVLEFLKLNKPQLSVLNETLTWQSVPSATSYRVTLEGGSEISTNTENSVILTNHVTTAGETFNVKAFSTQDNVVDSDASSSERCVKLAAPTNIAVMGTNIQWQSVNNSIGYDVQEGGSVIGSPTGVSMSFVSKSAKTYAIQVVAKGDGTNYFNSEPSNMFNFTKLATLTITAAGGEISWKALAGASEYKVEYSSSGKIDTVTSTKYKPTFAVIGQNVTLKVRAMTTEPGYMQSSDAEFVTNVEKLTAPQAVTIARNGEGRIVITTATISQVAGVRYGFTINGSTQYSDTNSITVDINQSNTSIAIFLEGKVFAENGAKYYINSDSVSKPFNIPSAPINLAIGKDVASGTITMTWGTQSTVNFIVTFTIKDSEGNILAEETEKNIGTSNKFQIYDKAVEGKQYTIEFSIKSQSNNGDLSSNSSTFKQTITM